MAGFVYLRGMSQINGLTLKGISIHSMDWVLECQWTVEPAKPGKKKLGTRSQLGYGGGHPCNPPTWPQNDHNDSINRMTRYGEQNASSMRTGNYPNASKFQDRNELYGNRQYVNEPNYIQENHWRNSLDGGRIFQATPINCQNKCLEQMWHLLSLFKQG